jgi:hypothetical protein
MQPIEVFYIAIVNWLVVTILVESTLFDPWRQFVLRLGAHITLADGTKLPPSGKIPEGVTQQQIEQAHVTKAAWSIKLAQLVTCHMCLGVWVGFAEALYFGGPFHGWAAIVANGLLFKAGGHLVLELRSRVAKP